MPERVLEATASRVPLRGSGFLPRSRRYAALAAAIGGALIVMYFSFQILFDQQNLVVKQSKINLWFLAQTQLEYERLMREMDKFGVEAAKHDGEGLSQRFELFWSRLPVLIEGPQSADMRAVDGLQPAVQRIIKQMEQLEPKIARLAGGDMAGYEEVRSALTRFRGPIEDFTRNALLYDSRLDSSYRQAHQAYFYQLLGAFAIMLAGGSTFFVMFYVQTQRARRLFAKAIDAEHAASVARSQLLEAIDSISEGFILYDADDRVVLFNDRYRALHRHVAQELRIGMTFEEILRCAVARGAIPLAPPDVEAWIKDCVARHRKPAGAFEHELKDGTWLKISERRTADGRLVGVHSDITEIKRRELELIAKSSLLRATLDNMVEGICVFDSARGLICWNERFVEMHDLPPGLLRIGCRYEELVPHLTEGGEAVDSKGDGSLADPAALIAKVQGSEEKRLRFERQRADGSTIEITVTLTPDGGFVKTYSDITDRVVAEGERAKLLERFHTNQKMEAIGTLAGGVAHDFNNILGIIIGYCDLLGDEIPATGPAGEMLRQVAKAGERAKLLVQQILTYSRNFDCTLEPCDIAQEVRNSCDLLASSIPPNIVLTLDRVESSTVAADRAQIHQILLNLVTNSVHAIGDRPGTIAVSVAPARPEAAGANAGAGPQKARREADRARRAARIVIGTVKDIPYCRIAVRDSGGGIDPVVMSRIFEPFFTTKEVGKGTGLGLAVVYGIARNHDGVIEVESASGQGVEFNIYLPVLAAQHAGEAPANDASGQAGSERVLLVDDDKVLLLVQKSLLEKLGYRVEAFNSPGKALDALRADPQRWDLVITDRNMASMNGEEFAARVLQRRPMAPVIMCTGYLDLADETRILGLGVRSILMKPVTGAKLSAAIRAAMQPPAALDEIRARPA